MIFFGDVKSYLNAAMSNQPVVLVNGVLSAFRIHDQQASASSIRPAGFYEWDLLRRYIFRLGYLSEEEFEIGLKNQVALYEKLDDKFCLKAELVRIAKTACDENDYLEADFKAVVANADMILS